MCDQRCRKQIEELTEAIKDAKHHIKHCEPEKAQQNLTEALCLLSHLAALCTDHSAHRCCCPCCCHHAHRNKVVLTSRKFFTKASSGTAIGADIGLPASVFVDDNGNGVSILPSDFQYYNCFINGMIQENSICRVSPFLVLILQGASLDGDDPIALEFVSSQSSESFERR